MWISVPTRTQCAALGGSDANWRFTVCGIVGYVGPRGAQAVLIDGLRKLEYRGYDSAGIAISDGATIRVSKAEGKLDRLAALLDVAPVAGNVGIGHTRWATHGPANDVNAHPHTDMAGKVAVVHNGIIDNAATLRAQLADDGIELVCHASDGPVSLTGLRLKTTEGVARTLKAYVCTGWSGR